MEKRIKHETEIEEFCIVCRKTEELRLLSTKYRNNSVVENCFEMFVNCFNIKFPVWCGPERYSKMCEECIARLRYCCEFRIQVEMAANRLHTCATTILETNTSTKEEPTEVSYTTDDDNPLIVLKNKSKYQTDSRKHSSVTMNKDNLTIQKNGEKYGQLRKLLFGDTNESIETDNLSRDDDTESDRWSTNTDEIYKATGYYDEISKLENKTRFTVPPLETDCLICPVCGASFEQRHSLIRHYDNHYPNWLCELCGVSYVYRGSFRGHQKNNCRENERHQCSECDRTYKTFDMVRRHIKYHHKGDKAMSCYHCPRKFTGTVSRRMHMYKEHGIQCDLFQCSMCHLKFFTEYRLKWHTRWKHFNEINFTCDVCSAGFFAKFQLRDHMLKHSDVKIHQCEFCEKAFVRAKSLKEHIKIHLNIRKHNCDVCGLTFVQKCSLNTHLKTHNKQL